MSHRFVIVAALLLAACGGSPTAEVPTPVAMPVPTEAPTVVPVPTETPEPTDTPEPTATPTEVPTPTPVPPTATPTEVPTPTPPPEPITLAGNGQDVTDPFTPPGPVNQIIFQHDGRRNFIVTLYGPDGSQGILVNKIGPYRGIRPLIGTGPFYLEVQADGAWQAVVMVIERNDAYAQGLEGSGDVVSGLFSPTKTGPAPFEFSHTGERNFIVYLHCAGGSDVVQNAIGAVGGAAVVNFREGPCLWEVQADGDWTIAPRQ